MIRKLIVRSVSCLNLYQIKSKILGKGAHWTKGAKVTRGGHQIDKFILKRLKERKENGISVPEVS